MEKSKRIFRLTLLPILISFSKTCVLVHLFHIEIKNWGENLFGLTLFKTKENYFIQFEFFFFIKIKFPKE